MEERGKTSKAKHVKDKLDIQEEKRGISPLIATVLIIGFTVALGAVITVWGGGFIKGMQEGTELSAEKSGRCAAAALVLEDVEQTDVNRLSFLLENTGQVDIKGVIVRITGEDGAASRSLPGIKSAAKKAYKDVEFDPVGVVAKINIIPNLEIQEKPAPCTPGIELEAETPGERVQEIKDRIGKCGDGSVETWEGCDGSPAQTCIDVGFAGGELKCTADCVLDISECEGAGDCGNEQLDAGEECDVDAWGDVLPGTESCIVQGFRGGELKCRYCAFDTRGCAEKPKPKFTQLAVGAGYTCGLADTGDVYCWGYNVFGQLGVGDTADRSTPTKTPMTGATQITAGNFHTCALTEDNKMYCWGHNGYGQIGIGIISTSETTPVQIQMESPTAISAGGYHTCATNTAGMYCWGRNNNGQIGNGLTVDTASPTLNQMESPTVISAGGSHTCATNTAGMYCWGFNGNGQIGDGTKNNQRTTPTKNLMTSPIAISAGGRYTCATNTAGMYCWGHNQYGQIGNGLTGDTASPTLNQMESPIAISAGGYHTCATNTAGMYCWGFNGNGQLGDGSTADRSTPTKNLMTSPIAISAEGKHTCAIDADRNVWCWGYNFYGQLGDGTTMDSASPVKVVLSV